MSNFLSDLVAKVDGLLSHANEVKAAVDEAVSAPNAEQAIVDALIVALESQGYIVTAPAKKINVVDAGEAAVSEPNQ